MPNLASLTFDESEVSLCIAIFKDMIVQKADTCNTACIHGTLYSQAVWCIRRHLISS